MKVTNKFGCEVDFETAVALMDDEIREEIHRDGKAETEQEFFGRYCVLHAAKYGEWFEAAKENPVM